MCLSLVWKKMLIQNDQELEKEKSFKLCSFSSIMITWWMENIYYFIFWMHTIWNLYIMCYMFFLMNPAQSKPKTDLYCSETNIHVIYTKFPEQLPYFFPQFNNHSQRPTAAQEAVFIQSDIPGWCFSEGGKCQSSVTTSWKWCLRLTPAEPLWGKMREWKVWFLPDVMCFCVCCRCTLRLPAQPTTTGTHRVIPPPNLPVLASQALSLCQVITFTHTYTRSVLRQTSHHHIPKLTVDTG